jgi:AcrR family transcriptional regulator
LGRVAAAARPLPVTARGQRTRQKLIDAAEHVFGGAGYHQAGIAEITQRAGVGLGTFYLYFPDKHAIFADLVRTLNHRLRADIQAAIASLDDRVDQEIAGFDAFFKFIEHHRNLYQVIRQAEAVDPALHRWHYETLAKGYIRGLRAAQGRSQISRDLDPEGLAFALMGMAEAFGMRWVHWDKKRPSAAARRSLALMLQRGLRPIRAAGPGSAGPGRAAFK